MMLDLECVALHLKKWKCLLLVELNRSMSIKLEVGYYFSLSSLHDKNCRPTIYTSVVDVGSIHALQGNISQLLDLMKLNAK